MLHYSDLSCRHHNDLWKTNEWIISLFKSSVRSFSFCFSSLTMFVCSSLYGFFSCRLLCRAPAICILEPLCSYYCSYSPGEKASVDRTNGDHWRRTKQREERVALKAKGGGNDRLREGENFSLRELQYRDSKGILIIMRTKILGEKEVDELRDLGVLKLGREADWWRRMQEERAVKERGGCWTDWTIAELVATHSMKGRRGMDIRRKRASVALSSLNSCS